MNYSTSTSNTLLEINSLIKRNEIKDCEQFETLVNTLPSELQQQVKEAFEYHPGWLFAGADFSALEERIGAILSQDPNRIKVYTDGYDGHSMRAYKYFADQMPDITSALAKAKTATKFWISDKGEYCCE
jgi:hypothetical protein